MEILASLDFYRLPDASLEPESGIDLKLPRGASESERERGSLGPGSLSPGTLGPRSLSPRSLSPGSMNPGTLGPHRAL